MKTSIKSTVSKIIIALILSMTVSLETHAQRYYRPHRIFLGVQAAMSTRSLQLTSDIPELNVKNQIQEGGSFGVVFGNQRLLAKVRQGYFHSSNVEAKPLKQSESYVSVQYVPIRSRKKVFKYFSPYFASGLSSNSIQSEGNYTPPVKKTTDASSSTCCCKDQQSKNGGMDDPDLILASAEKQPKTEHYAGKFKTSRMNMGVGFQTNIQKGNIFAHLFAEVRYGIVTGSHNTTPALLHTKASNMVAVDFGIALGLTGVKP